MIYGITLSALAVLRAGIVKPKTAVFKLKNIIIENSFFILSELTGERFLYAVIENTAFSARIQQFPQVE